MAKKEKNIIETKWLEIKTKSKVDNPNIEEIDQLTCRLIADLADLTTYREKKLVKPISEIIKLNPLFLKNQIERMESQLKPGEVILNTNLKF
jgi:hypothetical protein